MPKALAKVIFWSVTYFSRSFGMMMRESTLSLRAAIRLPDASLLRLQSLEGLCHNTNGQNGLCVSQVLQ